MVIIIEGVDRVGKTTLALKLKEKLNCEIYHDKAKKNHDVFNSEEVDSKFRNHIRNIKSSKESIIYDRFHLSELVYDSMRGQKFNLYNKVDRELNYEQAILILVISEDINESSRQHGSFLGQHELAFVKSFFESKIQRKILIQYNRFDEMIERCFGE